MQNEAQDQNQALALGAGTSATAAEAAAAASDSGNNNRRRNRASNEFIRMQYHFGRDADGIVFTCKHCGIARHWLTFNATLATSHIVSQCPAVNDEIKAQAQLHTQKAIRMRKRKHKRTSGDDNDEHDDDESYDEDDNEEEAEEQNQAENRDGIKDDTKEARKSTSSRAAKRKKRSTSNDNSPSSTLVLISKDELRKLQALRKEVSEHEQVKLASEKNKMETDLINSKITMASTLLEKRQELAEKGVPREDIDKLLPLSMLEKKENE